MSCNISDYCKDKDSCKDITEAQKKYYEQVCSKGDKNVDSLIAQQLIKFGEKFGDFFKNLIMGMLSPEGLLILSGFYSIELTGNFIFGAMLKGSLLDKALVTNLEKFCLESGEKISSKAAIGYATTIINSKLEKTIAEKLLFNSVKMLGSTISGIWNVANIIMIMGTLVDVLWDPCSYNQIVSKEVLKEVSNNFNLVFTNKVYYNLDDSCTDKCDEKTAEEDGKKNGPKYTIRGNRILTSISSIPMEYDFMYTISSDEELFKDLKYDYNGSMYSYDDYYTFKMTEYCIEYLKKMKVNALGRPIYWNDQRDFPIDDKTSFESSRNWFALQLANQNTVVQKWIAEYWIYILLVILILIFILLIIK
jgi:hypothetical protein